MKCNTSILFVALTLAIPGAVNAAATVVVLNQMATQKQKEREDQLEAVGRDALAQPDAWKEYLQVSDAVPADASILLQNCYRSLAVSLALKAELLEHNDVIEFRLLRSSLVSASGTAK